MNASRLKVAMPVRQRLFICAAAALLAINLSASEEPLAIDKANSRIEIQVKTTVDSFVGKLLDYEPTVVVDPASSKVVATKIAFHFKDVKTGNEKRDREMNVWQETGKFPEGDFTLGALEPSADGKRAASGVLTLHGVTRPLLFPVLIVRNGATITVEGDATVDTRLFGLPVIRKFAFLKVDPLVVVHFHLAGVMSTP